MIGIFTTGRSGSSLVAGLFAKHGVWVGDTASPSQWNEKGYFENSLIKREQIKHFGRDLEGPELTPDSEWENHVTSLLVDLGATEPCLFKTGAFYYPAWQNIVEKVVKVRKPYEDIIQSYENCNFLPAEKFNVEIIVKRQLEMLEKMPGKFVDVNKFLDDDFSQLKEVFEYCEIKYNQAIVDDFYEKDLHNI